MARGWESKAIEQQQDEASRRGDSSGPREASATDRRRSLELARTQVVARRDAARTQAQRAAVEETLAAIDRQIAEIEPPGA